jgi:hypothetical protein
MRKKPVQSDFLFARPSALTGVARFFDWGGAVDAYNASEDEEEADAKALYADWRAVGETLTSAMEEFETESERDEKAA